MEYCSTIDPRDQVLDVPNNLEAQVAFINAEIMVINNLCQLSRKIEGAPDPQTVNAMFCHLAKKMGGGGPDPNTVNAEVKGWLLRLELFMRWVETNVEISPTLNERTRIGEALQLMFDKPEYHFQETTRYRARTLYERWQAQAWGKGEVIEERSDDDANAVTSDDATTVRLPPRNHPIFGIGGIMHGVCLRIGPLRKDYVLDSRYQQRDAKVYGHNGLQVGDWWPLQVLALFHGAHGSRSGGIAGNAQTGAYSVVTAGGTYEELDQDKGDVLFYSGSNSHKNTDPQEPFASSNATLALKASQRLYKPVRVLRSAGTSKSSAAATLRPRVGIRYDGLYHVVAMQLKTNTNGGLYEQFKLERMEGQPPLGDFVKSRPTAQELRVFDRRVDGY
jgi:hypothetical protein